MMIETYRRVAPFVFKISSTLADRVGSIAVWRGGTWNSRPIRAGAAPDRRQGVTVNGRFYPLVEIMNSPQASSPIAR